MGDDPAAAVRGKGGAGEGANLLSLPELTVAVEKGDIDTVVVAFTDMQGRLVGKRLQAQYFLEEIGAGEPIEGCNYLLALEMEMDPVPGYQIASWERGYGDFDMVPDMSTLRRIPWLEGTALVLSDVAWHDGSPVRPSPRQVLKAQVERARALGFEPMFGSELEFYLFKETFAEANARHYRGLTPSVPYILDYHILATSYDEPFIRAVRNGMQGAGLRVESSKGEAWPGQQEINFRFADAVTMADHHTIYKNGIKEIAQQHGCSVTFMAKPDHSWIGNSCHVHSSLWNDGRSAFEGESAVFKGYLAGQIAHAAELAVFLAPNVNSYKRYAAGSWAPTTLAWGYDNRTCGFRIVGHGQGLRTESRIPGADANPYLAFAALLAAGLHGIEQDLPLPPAFEGNAYESDVKRFPNTLRGAIAALEGGGMAREAFGEEVVDHYLNYARTEQKLFDQVVTCYERERFFERG
jgi:glutamine synthetase